MEHEIKCSRYTLKIDAENLKYSVVLASGKTWTMTKRPYILFSSGDVIEFPRPREIKVTKTGTYDGVRTYFDIPNTEISIMTHVYVDRTTDDLIFEFRLDGDKMCEIENVAYPAPFDFGARPGEGYTVLPRMQGTLVPAGTSVPCMRGSTVYPSPAFAP